MFFTRVRSFGIDLQKFFSENLAGRIYCDHTSRNFCRFRESKISLKEIQIDCKCSVTRKNTKPTSLNFRRQLAIDELENVNTSFPTEFHKILEIKVA